MIQLEEAVRGILAAVSEPVLESVSLTAAHQRIAAKSIRAPMELPVFDNSSMDGYAIRAEDVVSATAESPVRLRVTGRITPGQLSIVGVEAGTAIRVFTGSALPEGATAVVMQEDTRSDPGRPGEVSVVAAVKPWENIRFKGEDVKLGSDLVSSGEVLTAGRLGLLAAVGIAEVRVARRPMVGLLATGSELKNPGETLAAGQIYESNRAMLSALTGAAGGVPQSYPIVPDDLNLTASALNQALQECDFVITSGGISVGEVDLVKTAFEQLGGVLEFWKVSMKPGKPFAFGRLGRKLLFGLPGNPVSAMVTFLLLVRPALRRLQGATDVYLRSYPGVLAEDLANRGERRHFMRVKMDSRGKISKAGIQASHLLNSAAAANGLVDVPGDTTFTAGTVCPMLRWD